MSRYPHTKLPTTSMTNVDNSTELVRLENEAVKSICSMISVLPPYAESLNVMNINILDATEIPGTTMAQLELREIRKSQMQDNIIGKWRLAVIDNKVIDKTYTKQDITMRKNFKHFNIKRGVLFRVIKDDEKKIEQLVVPECYRSDILKGLHTDIGHPGIERCTRLIRERFFWPGMSNDIEEWIKKCDRCLRRKAATNIRAPLMNVNTSYPLELVCFDFLSLESSKGGFSSILVITDHYTKFAMAIPTKNQTAKTTAEAFFNNFIVHYGIPTRLHSDQGANFESDIIKELCLLTNIKKTHTSVYHPQGNAGPERFNRTLINMLGTLENNQKADWKKYINALVFAYNNTTHESTGYAPYELMFGRSPKLPIDTMFEEAMTDGQQSKTTQEYIQDLKDRMKTTKEIAEKYIKRSKEKQKFYYDKKVRRGGKLERGDQVLVRILARGEGKHKLADKYEEELYTVIEMVRDELPVYVVEGNDTHRIRKLHRNYLFPVDYRVQLSVTEKDVQSVIPHLEAVENGTLEYKNKEKDISKEEEQVNEGDVTESSDDEGGVVFINYMDTCGDAHEPNSPLEKVSPDNNAARKEEKDSSQPSKIKSVSEDVSVKPDTCTNSEFPKTNTNKDSLDKDNSIALSEENVTNENRAEVCSVSENDVRQEAATGTLISTEEEKAVENEERVKDTAKKKRNKRLLPPDPPRRSDRISKIPDRYGPYISFRMQEDSTNSRFDALKSLMSSGILDRIDSEIARKIVKAIMK